MSVETDPVPPVPQHTPPLDESRVKEPKRLPFTVNWMQWFLALRDKVNIINDSIVNLADVGSGPGIVAKNGASWLLRTITGTSNRVTVADGDGASGNPTIDVVTADLVAGTNVSFSSSGTDRIIDNGSGNLTISAGSSGGGSISPAISNLIIPVNADSANARFFRDSVNGTLYTMSADSGMVVDPLDSSSAVLAFASSSFATGDTTAKFPATADFTLEILFDASSFAVGGVCMMAQRDSGAAGWAFAISSTGQFTFRAFVGTWSDTKLSSAVGAVTTGNRRYIRVDKKGANLRALYGVSEGGATSVIATAVEAATSTLQQSGSFRLARASSAGEQPFTGNIKQVRLSTIFLPDTGVVPTTPWSTL